MVHKSSYRMLNSPFKWVGGKSRLRKHIIPLLPSHTCYVEPFAGAAWVLFGKPRSDVEVLNDKDEDLITFFRVVKEKPEDLIASFDWTFASRAEFERLATQVSINLTDVERAHRFYYLIMAGWGGELNYPRFQTSITDGGHGNRLIGALKTLRERLSPIYDRLRTVIIENADWQDCVDRYDRPQTVMYLDPPYPQNDVNYVHNMRDWENHRVLAERLAHATSRWIVSSYDFPQTRALFPNCFYVPIQSASGMTVEKNNSQRVVNRELLILNYKPLLSHAETGKPEQRMLPDLEG